MGQLARAKLFQHSGSTPEESRRKRIAKTKLVDLIPQLSPVIKGQPSEAPQHLGPLVGELETMVGPHKDQRFFYFSVPPRHWKSYTVQHAIVKHLLMWPDSDVAYCTHTATFANSQSKKIRDIAERAGIKLAADSNRQDEWEIDSGATLVARGVGGEVTGRGFRLIVIDDPVKSREQAESRLERNRIFNWIEDDIITRLTPDGAVLLVHTRWHDDDPIGRYKRGAPDNGWQGDNLPALYGPREDIALLPKYWPAKKLIAMKQANPIKFAALYQGQPRPKGGSLFGEPSWYDLEELPKSGYRCGHGVDLAYSSRSQADRSVLWSGIEKDGRFFVTNVVMRRVPANVFAETLNAGWAQWPGGMLWYRSGAEAGAASLMQEMGVPLDDQVTQKDKYGRALPLAMAWNQGQVLLPRGAPWAKEVIHELTTFTGVGDENDDIVDAGAAWYDLLATAHVDASLLDRFQTSSRWDGYEGRGF